jgi:hypothetical protein
LCTIRNGNLALLLKARLFPATSADPEVGDAVLYVILFYSGASLVVSGSGVLIRRITQRQALSQRASAGQASSVLPSSLSDR